MRNGCRLVVSIFVDSKQFGSFQVEVNCDLHDCMFTLLNNFGIHPPI